jgi:outer membrane protein OmpA-like peptidoglycan-associated protein
MIKVVERLTGIVGVLILLMLAGSGCASKKYVSQQIAPLNQKLAQYQKQTDARLAWMNNKEQNDIAQVNDRIASTDQNVSQLTSGVQSAQGSASRAMEAGSANSEAIQNLGSDVSKTLNYQLVDKADVLFAFNKAALTPAAKATLDDVVSKFQSMPRGVVELAGYTDRVGASNYNLELSRRRAWAVQRYLAQHDVPLRSIHMIGFGEEAPAEDLKPAGDRNSQARRVNIRVYGAADIVSSDAAPQSGSDPNAAPQSGSDPNAAPQPGSDPNAAPQPGSNPDTTPQPDSDPE